MNAGIELTPPEFDWIVAFLRRATGIELKDGKQTLVMGRLERRLRLHGLNSYTEYCQMIGGPDGGSETQMAIDLLTTNETYFFREEDHFTRLPHLLPDERETGSRKIRIWSAASSSGEEAYTIALTMAGCRPGRFWEVIGSDISSRVLETARRCLYPIEAAERIPEQPRRAFCLKGRGEHEGLFTLKSELRSRVSFVQVNLMAQLPDLGMFDVVFLRNVMIYSSDESKFHLLIGHAESLHGLNSELAAVAPSVYHKSPV